MADAKISLGSKPTSDTVEFQFQVGLGGIDYKLSFVPTFEDGSHSEISDNPSADPRNYKVIVTLGRPGFSAVPERRFLAHEQNQGDSHLAIAAPALRRPGFPDSIRHFEIRTDTPDGNFTFAARANDRGFLGTLIADSIMAKNADDATAKIGKALAPTLSNLSMHLDVPLRIQQTEILDLQTGARHLIFQVPYNDTPLIFPPTTTLSDEFMRYASCYREALGSNTPAYQFLCFFKILDALRKRRHRRAAEAAGRGTCVSIIPERVPGETQDFVPWLNSIFPVRPAWDDLDLTSIFLDEACGKKISRIVDTHFRSLRNAIAHAILDTDEGTIKDGDELEIANKLSKWLPLTKCIVRRMLKVEFPTEFLRELPTES